VSIGPEALTDTKAPQMHFLERRGGNSIRRWDQEWRGRPQAPTSSIDRGKGREGNITHNPEERSPRRSSAKEIQEREDS